MHTAPTTFAVLENIHLVKYLLMTVTFLAQ